MEVLKMPKVKTLKEAAELIVEAAMKKKLKPLADDDVLHYAINYHKSIAGDLHDEDGAVDHLTDHLYDKYNKTHPHLDYDKIADHVVKGKIYG
jgi:hypothetical protein